MSRRALAASALAFTLAAAAGPAAAFVRTTDASSGVAVAWPVPVVPYHVNPDWPAASPACGGGGALAQVRSGFAEWEQDCTSLRLLYGGESSGTATGLGGSHENLVVFRRGWCSQRAPAADACWAAGNCDTKYDCFDDDCAVGASTCDSWGILAQTSVLYDPGTGRIYDADMELNGWDGTATAIPPSGTKPPHGWYFTCVDPSSVGSVACATYGQGACDFIDLRNTVTHEAGHFLGLRHPCTFNPTKEPGLPLCTSTPPSGEIPYAVRTMYPNSAPGDVVKRTLSTDDREGVCDIYPLQPGGCGCGGGGAAGTLSLLVAALALRPLSGRRAPRTPRPPRRPR